jgi:hypothetical protein
MGRSLFFDRRSECFHHLHELLLPALPFLTGNPGFHIIIRLSGNLSHEVAVGLVLEDWPQFKFPLSLAHTENIPSASCALPITTRVSNSS